jgi:hypothetical protein
MISSCINDSRNDAENLEKREKSTGVLVSTVETYINGNFRPYIYEVYGRYLQLIGS